MSRALWSRFRIILDPPILQEGLGLLDRTELLAVQELVAEPALKLSTQGFCHGQPGLMNTLAGV